MSESRHSRENVSKKKVSPSMPHMHRRREKRRQRRKNKVLLSSIMEVGMRRMRSEDDRTTTSPIVFSFSYSPLVLEIL